MMLGIRVRYTISMLINGRERLSGIDHFGAPSPLLSHPFRNRALKVGPLKLR